LFTSSTHAVPEARSVPRHIAIIMDGNGRWAKQRLLPRVAGHRKGVEAVRATVRACIESGVEYLTLFAFSSENWRRPADEVSILMQLFMRALEQEVAKLHDNGIRFRAIGDTSRFEPKIRELIAGAETQTATNSRLTLTIAANYGGRWDIAQAAGKLAEGKFLYSMVLSDDSVKFPVDGSRLSPEAQTRLMDLAQKLKADNKNVYLEIQGHTDATGPKPLNMRLGEARAEAVRLFMNQQGVPLNRMSAISYGDESPVAPNSTRSGRAQNRRVAVIVMA